MRYRYKYRCGDGRKFVDMPSAERHAVNVARETGNIIAVEVLMNDTDALNAVCDALHGQSWTPETMDRIAAIVRATGREIGEPE